MPPAEARRRRDGLTVRSDPVVIARGGIEAPKAAFSAVLNSLTLDHGNARDLGAVLVHALGRGTLFRVALLGDLDQELVVDDSALVLLQVGLIGMLPVGHEQSVHARERSGYRALRVAWRRQVPLARAGALKVDSRSVTAGDFVVCNLRDGTVVRRLEGLPLERDHPVKGDLAEGHRRLLVLLRGGVDLALFYRVQVRGVGALPNEKLAERGAVDVHERVAKHRLPQAVHDVVESVARPGGSFGLLDQ
mmetsp:Transcript_3432/g.8615  ORF Transcript_3432/g.8615 Transcript_3432/m.8615 type:complete len:248 (+) Transcript_3432:730-1473(+)